MGTQTRTETTQPSSSLFRTKSIDRLQVESGNAPLKRTLGPMSLVALGIGAIIGAGLFVRTAAAIAERAGPSVTLAFMLAGVGCAFAGLCYAEFASMIPIAGSAYTYSYATLGEFVAWIIGWDLVLEYALGAATVAVGWSGYVVSLLYDLGIPFPALVSAAPGTAVTFADGSAGTAIFNLPAVIVAGLVTLLLVRGVQESASVNSVMVVVKVSVVLIVIAAGVSFVHAANYQPFIPANRGA